MTAGGNAQVRYSGVVKAAGDWNTALGKIVFMVLPLGSVAADAPEGAPVVPVDLQATVGQVYTPGETPGPSPVSVGNPTSAYTQMTMTGPTKGGVITGAQVWVYYGDPDSELEGIVGHELMRVCGAVAGASPNPGDILYPTGTHGRPSAVHPPSIRRPSAVHPPSIRRPSAADVATIAAIYSG